MPLWIYFFGCLFMRCLFTAFCFLFVQLFLLFGFLFWVWFWRLFLLFISLVWLWVYLDGLYVLLCGNLWEFVALIVCGFDRFVLCWIVCLIRIYLFSDFGFTVWLGCYLLFDLCTCILCCRFWCLCIWFGYIVALDLWFGNWYLVLIVCDFCL